MQAVKTFFRTLIKSTISPEYYNDVVKAPASFSWKFFLVFSFLGSLVLGLVVAIPLALINVSSLVTDAADVYPADLEVRGDEQGISINQPLPYSISWPVSWQERLDEDLREEYREEVAEEQMPRNIITFISEEQATAGARVVEDYDSFAVITPNTVYVREDDGTYQVRAYPIPEFTEPFVFDRAELDGWVAKIANNPFVSQRWYAPAIGLFVMLVSYPFLLIWRILTLALYSLIVWVITRITMSDKQLSFSKVFQIGMHSMTLITLAAIVINLVTVFTLGGLFYVVAFLIWTIYLIAQLRPTAVAQAQAQVTPFVTSVAPVAPASRARRVSARKPAKARRPRRKKSQV